MKSEILRLYRKLELFGIKFEENPNNFSFSHNGNRYYAGKLVNDYVALKEENKALKQRIKDLEDVCDGSCFTNETDDRDEKIAKMQDRIDSDCVRINRLKVTINTLVDMYGLLRNQVGMD